MKTYNPNVSVPEEISRKARELKTWMEMFSAESIYGMGNVTDLQRQLADAIRERDQYKAAWEMAHARQERNLKIAIERYGCWPFPL